MALAVLTALGSMVAIDTTSSSAAGRTMKWGARVEKRGVQSDTDALNAMESAVDRTFDVVRIFGSWEQSWPDSYANAVGAGGRIPLLSVKPKRNNGQIVTWSAIANAAPGSTIRNEIVGWANKVKAFPGRVYFTFHHEPEATANLSYGVNTDYIAAWRAVVGVFRSEGVTNATFLWIMTDFSFGLPSTERRQAVKWYPGDAWVDAIGADAYNWVNCRARNEGWKSLQQIIEPLRQFGLQHPTKELWLPEFASVEDAAVPGRKAQWINDAAALFKQPGWEQFHGVSYFHFQQTSFPNCVWYVDTSTSSLAAFAAMGQDSFYGGTVTPPVTDDVLLVVGDPAAPTAVEAELKARLAARGVNTVYADDLTVTPSNAAGFDAVLISSSVASSMAARLRDVSLPVVVWKAWIYDDMRMTGTVANVDFAFASVSTAHVSNAAHAIAAGLGTDPALFSSKTHGIGIPAGSADVIVTAGGSAAVFVQTQNTPIAGGFIAPGCRIAFPGPTSNTATLNADGWTLLLNTVGYAIAGCA